MAFELLTKTLTEVGLAPEVVTQLVSNEKAAKQIQEWHESGLRQSDYDRKMNSGKAEIEAAKKTLQEQMDAFEQNKKAINEQYMGALTTREQAEAQLATLRAKAKTVSDLYGVDIVKELFGEGSGNPPPPKPPETKLTIPEELERRMRDVENLVPLTVQYATEITEVYRQHQELFPDKPMDFNKLLEDSKTQRRSPLKVWDDQFGATARRNEIQAEKYRAEGAAAEREKIEKERSGQLVNGMRTDLPLSPIFQLSKNKDGLSAPKDRQARAAETIQNAVAAFTSGKYRPGGRSAEQ